MAKSFWEIAWRTILRRPETREERNRQKNREQRQRRRDPNFVPHVGLPPNNPGNTTPSYFGSLLGFFGPIFSLSDTASQGANTATGNGTSQDTGLVQTTDPDHSLSSDDEKQYESAPEYPGTPDVQENDLQSHPPDAPPTDAPTASDSQAPTSRLGLTTSVQRQVYCPPFPEELRTMKKKAILTTISEKATSRH